jgi:nucleolar protein 16
VLDDEEEVVEEEPEAEGSSKPLNVEAAPLAPVVAKTEVVRRSRLARESAGEELADTARTRVARRLRRPRHPPHRGAWLVSSVQKHGDDYEAMAKDRKLNVWQKTPGELKRMVRKAGGVQKLLA